MAHILHPDIHESGLADDCPRCAEHADHPEGLDVACRRDLRSRIEAGAYPRSEYERRAMRNLMTVKDRFYGPRLAR